MSSKLSLRGVDPQLKLYNLLMKLQHVNSTKNNKWVFHKAKDFE